MLAHITSVGSHDRQVVLVDDLLHLLDTSQVSQHVTDRDDIAVLDETFSDGLGGLDGSGTDGLKRQLYPCSIQKRHAKEAANLFDEVSGLREVLDQVNLEIGALGRTTSVGWGTTDDNSAVSISRSSVSAYSRLTLA